MSRASKKPLRATNTREAWANVGTDQGSNRAKHSSNAMALCLLLHTAISAARVLVSRLALLTDSPPFGLVEAADSLDEAGDLIAELVATGGKP